MLRSVPCIYHPRFSVEVAGAKPDAVTKRGMGVGNANEQAYFLVSPQ